MGFSVNIFNGRVDKRFNNKDTCTLGARDFFMRGFRFRPEDLSACARHRRIPPQARKLFVLRVAKRALNAQSRIQRVWYACDETLHGKSMPKRLHLNGHTKNMSTDLHVKIKKIVKT